MITRSSKLSSYWEPSILIKTLEPTPCDRTFVATPLFILTLITGDFREEFNPKFSRRPSLFLVVTPVLSGQWMPLDEPLGKALTN